MYERPSNIAVGLESNLNKIDKHSTDVLTYFSHVAERFELLFYCCVHRYPTTSQQDTKSTDPCQC